MRATRGISVALHENKQSQLQQPLAMMPRYGHKYEYRYKYGERGCDTATLKF